MGSDNTEYAERLNVLDRHIQICKNYIIQSVTMKENAKEMLAALKAQRQILLDEMAG